MPKASKAIEAAHGVLYYKGIGEWPFIQQATISIWNSLEEVMQFFYKDNAHKQIVKQTKKERWYKKSFCPFFSNKRPTITLMNKKVVIIGAGIAGIATAIRLTTKDIK